MPIELTLLLQNSIKPWIVERDFFSGFFLIMTGPRHENRR